ncbi:MAG: UvrD-helicase domain-containing protein [Candidatus Saccharimonadaceae bacterium]
MSFNDRYTQLNSAQKQAVDTIDGPVMVVAGPGTGKTELLSVRVANILQQTDTLPENILCLTFTDSGQAAMRERLVGIIGKDAYKVAIHTFHSFGSEVMSHNREFFYRNALFEPADDLKQYEVLRGIFEELEFSNPLSSMMNGEYTHLSDAKRVISELKRSSALTSDELLAVIQQNEASLDALERILVPILIDRVGKTTADKLRDALELIQEHAATVEPLYEVTPLARIINESIEAMLEDTLMIHPTKPISAWKSAWFERDEKKNLVFKNRKRLIKLKSLSFVYYEYLSRMEKLGLFDYDDMIMQVVHAVEVHDDLKFNLQEKYLYVMVDEFQDTNLAQLRILHALTDNPVNEGAPNILVVGDDDQAVYGFQGADISNILNFSENYPNRQLIVLTDNYRSGTSILETSRIVITQGTDRLEDRIPELDKRLAAKGSEKSSVELWKASSIDSERYEIVRRIQQSIQKGTDPSSIAILARRHADIQSLLPFLRRAGVAVRYEREESVLDTSPLVVLEQVARVVLALAEGNHGKAQEMLPELLAHPAWKLDPKDLWRLSLDAYTNRQNWMEIMATTPQFVTIHEWLTAKAQEATTLALEPMIDLLMGRSDDETESPYFRYFFSQTALEENPETYIEYLGALRAIRAKLRDYQPREVLSLKSFIDFVELHRRLEIGITVNRYSLASDIPAIQLLTAHKSKGLEFETVYVFNSVDSVWGQSARSVSRSISYPENLPLAPTGNTADERLRLFYVAMTRAKQQLIITYAEANDSDKQTLQADFLLPVEAPILELNEPTRSERVETAELAWYEPYISATFDLQALLAPQIEKFKLSATSLNSFLDVTRGGPQHFLLNNLLHFPSTKPAPASYGTAVHWTMQQAHTHMAATGEQKPLEDSLHDFEVALIKERLAPSDFQHYLHQGSEHVPAFLTSGVLPMTKSQKAEVSFGFQDVRSGEARLTGSLDMIDISKQDKTMIVTDYKTGHPSLAWDKGDDHTKLKLHKYRQQLIFYKILVENSAEYHNYEVTHGQLAFIEPTKAGESVLLSLDLSAQDIERTTKLIQAVWKHIIALDLPDTSSYSPDLKGVLAFEQDLIDEVL